MFHTIKKIRNAPYNYGVPGRLHAFCTVLFIHPIPRKDMITLFMIAIAVFIYICYVLVKPEKF